MVSIRNALISDIDAIERLLSVAPHRRRSDRLRSTLPNRVAVRRR